MLDDMSISPSSSSRRRPKAKTVAENWDDDFEFSLPTKPKASSGKSTSGIKAQTRTTAGRGNENVDPGRTPSPDWDEEESWDELPPTLPASSPTIIAGPSKSVSSPRKVPPKVPAPLTIPSNPHAQPNPPPRLSPSQYAELPSPSPLPTSHTSSSQANLPLLSSRSHSSLATSPSARGLTCQAGEGSTPRNPRSRSGSTATGTLTRNKLIKRHPSTSFIPLPTRSSSHNLSSAALDISLSSVSHMNRSSPNLTQPPNLTSPATTSIPRSTSGEQMPPPPLPSHTGVGAILNRARSRSRSKSRSTSRQDARVSNIPFTPPREDRKEPLQAKRPGFWKRLSGAPSGTAAANGMQHQQRRRRSSSVGGRMLAEPASPQPPIPPLPANLRSPSSTSTVSTSSSKRSSPRSAFSAILRRSSSSLSRKSDKSRDRDTPPSSYPYFNAGLDRSSSASLGSYAVLPVPNQSSKSRSVGNTPDLPSSSSFSRGFHLPSPSPGSPYHPSKGMSSRNQAPPLPHSSSFPVPPAGKGSESDTETEADGKTPRRRKVRPVSALPAPRIASGKGWSEEGWKGFNDTPLPRSATTAHIPGLPNQRSDLPSPKLGTFANPSSGFASSTTSTLRRLGSLSKKHGRRLSGGFKFVTGSQSGIAPIPNTQSNVTPLETVMGSPSKLPKGADELASSVVPVATPGSEAALRSVLRAGSVSAPNSTFKPGPPLEASSPIGEVNDVAPEAAGKREDKHKRRQSWNDFVIPKEVMAKQRALKEKISAVKTFAGGVETLKTLLAQHEKLQRAMPMTTDSPDSALFQKLDQEFAQWWEMAVVLIEVSSTGNDPSTQASLSSPPRSRRVTLASDEAKAASEMMRKASSAPGAPTLPPSLSGLRKSSLPDPAESSLTMASGPPRASPLPPEQWRASTGRQDLSKRQLEVLRTMLRSPAPSSTSVSSTILAAQSEGIHRPVLGSRAASTLSASSTTSSQLALRSSPRTAGTLGPSAIPSRSRSRTPDSISFPSPGDSAHIVPSGSFPSPLAASRQAQQSDRDVYSQHRPVLLKDRRASKAGLAGLKDFLRSLQHKKSIPAAHGQTATPMKRGFKAMARSPSQVVMGRWSMKSSTSPPASPTSPIYPAFSRHGSNSTTGGREDEVSHPTNRTSFSALGAPVPTTPRREMSVQERGSVIATAPAHSTHASPRPAFDADAPKRPSLKNIFRHSSGGWKDLVLNEIPYGSTSPATPGQGKLSKQASSRNLSGSSNPVGAEKAETPVVSRHGTPNRGSISVSDPIPSRIPFSPSSGTITDSPAKMSHSSNRLEDTHSEGQGVDEMTLRPGRKSRSAGLGLGLGWPESSTLTANSVLTAATGGGVDEYGTMSKENRTAINDSTITNTRPSKAISNGIDGGREPSESRAVQDRTHEWDVDDPNPDSIQDPAEVMVALTPENLPVLLDYLKQCESKLIEWKGRVEEITSIYASSKSSSTFTV